MKVLTVYGVSFASEESRRDYLNRAYALGRDFGES